MTDDITAAMEELSRKMTAARLKATFPTAQGVPPPPSGSAPNCWWNPNTGQYHCAGSVKTPAPMNQPRSGGCECGGTCGGCSQAGSDEGSDEESDGTMVETYYIPGIPPAALVGGSGCNAYRGWPTPTVPLSKRGGSDLCAVAACSTQAPRGVWPIPFNVAMDAGEEVQRALAYPWPANLLALVVYDVTGVDVADVQIGRWKSQTFLQTYPAFGSDATFSDPNLAGLPATAYSPSAVLNGQNPLPGWVSQFNLNATNDVLRCSFVNTNAADAAVAYGLLIVNFG